MKPVVLLVDDNQDILEFISDDLNEKYTPLVALNGQDALEQLQQQAVQLVISDITMPVMDGYELCRTIKSNLEYSHIPVILLTARNTLQSKIEGLELGADAYIEKPFSPEHLQVQIANLLSNRNKIRQYFASSPLVNIKTIAYSKSDEQFLTALNEAIYQNIENLELSVEHLADCMNMSRATLYRKIKEISDLTPNELINITRLKKAAELLAEQEYKIYEVAELTGFSSQTHFGRNFTKQFGISPMEYMALKKEEKKK
ncbi:MAG: response regulator [Candidatus Pseudobacter hemicellulosilyticus]|uniref:Response regulator n=1 Tax=Candidatus Pseudobacter hemicellulosilyticus TaxID=3121375 RepID=A0AAJ5WVE2_9BACT|nr:MAG: response regulator [Pseudobacter sp.]